MSVGKDGDERALEELVASFFAAFTNKNGVVPNVQVLYDLFLPEGVIVKDAEPAPQIYSLREFVEPRRALLTNGALIDFEEAESSARTDIFGNIAHRLSFYRKSGVLSGQRFEATGVKSMQLVRTAAGWKLVSVTWHDD